MPLDYRQFASEYLGQSPILADVCCSHTTVPHYGTRSLHIKAYDHRLLRIRRRNSLAKQFSRNVRYNRPRRDLCIIQFLGIHLAPVGLLTPFRNFPEKL